MATVEQTIALVVTVEDEAEANAFDDFLARRDDLSPQEGWDIQRDGLTYTLVLTTTKHHDYTA